MATQPDFMCATCDAPITHHPTFHVGLAFCCAGCAADGPCMCSYDVETPALVAVEALVVAMSTVPGPVVTSPAPPIALPTKVRMPERTRVPATGAAPAMAAARR